MKNNLKVLILIGLPASGKTTFATNYIAKHDDYVKIGRDDFRYMLRNEGLLTNKLENMITDLVNYTVISSLNKKMNVIIDATNLRISDINDHIEAFGEYADIEYMFFDVPLKTCLERDKLRQRSVGVEVLNKMYENYKIIKDSFNFQPVKKRRQKVVIPNFLSDLPDAVIFDLDGTLALMRKRSPFDWDRVDEDDVNEIVLEQLKFHRSLGRKIILVSGRDGAALAKTKEWLEFYEIPYDYLFLKDKDDNRKDSIVKKEIYNNFIKDKFNVICAYDDRIQVLNEVWYKNNIFTFSVNQGTRLY